MISLIAALGTDRGIGYKGELLWRIPADMARFKQLTMDHVLVMGRKTFESIGKPLPRRVTVVVTRDPNWSRDDLIVTHSVKEALERAEELSNEVFVAGGAEIYEQALSCADKVYLTLIDAQKPADTFFPDWERQFTQRSIFEDQGVWQGVHYRFIENQR